MAVIVLLCHRGAENVKKGRSSCYCLLAQVKLQTFRNFCVLIFHVSLEVCKLPASISSLVVATLDRSIVSLSLVAIA